MEITFSHTPEDILRYNLYYQQVSATGRRRRRRIIGMMIVVGIMLVVVVYLRDPKPVVKWAMTALGVAVIVLAPWFYQWSLRRAIRRHLADERVARSFGDYRVKFDRQGLHSVSPVAESDVKWPQVTEVVCDGDDHRYVCFANGGALVISRRSYRGPVHFDQFADALDRLRHAR